MENKKQPNYKNDKGGKKKQSGYEKVYGFENAYHGTSCALKSPSFWTAN